MRKTSLLALLLLAPVVATAEERFTNSDLKRQPRRDAYTNADVEKLAPLPVALEKRAQPVPVDLGLDAAEADRSALLAVLTAEEDRLRAEVRYWEGVIARANHPGVGIDRYPRLGGDTNEARGRLKILDREQALLAAERAAVR